MSSTSNDPRPASSVSIPSPTDKPLLPYKPFTNVAPLTTYFTYLPACLNRWVFDANGSSVYSLYTSWKNSAKDLEWAQCQPLGYQTAYSPGICPVAYTMAYLGGEEYSASTGTVTEWQGLCCSSGLGEVDALAHCFGTLTKPITVLVTSAMYATSTITSRSNVTTSSYWKTTTQTTTITGVLGVADGLRVYWKEEDLLSFPEEYAVNIAKQMGVSFTPSSSPRTEGLSTGAKIGIGVGVGMAALLALLLAVYFMLRRRRRTRSTQNASSDVAGASTAEMEDQDATLATRKWYLGRRWRSEADVKDNKHPGELDSRSVRVVGGSPVELDGPDVHERRI